jgi:hypothetical protein
MWVSRTDADADGTEPSDLDPASLSRLEGGPVEVPGSEAKYAKSRSKRSSVGTAVPQPNYSYNARRACHEYSMEHSASALVRQQQNSIRRIEELTSSTRDPRTRRPAATPSCALRTSRSRYAARSSAHSHVLSPPSYVPGTRSAGASANAVVCSSGCSCKSESWKRTSKRSRRASVCPSLLVPLLAGAGSVIGEYENASGSAESCAAKPR